MSWTRQAQCRGHEDVFDAAIDHPGRHSEVWSVALGICRDCPVQRPCLDDAMVTEGRTYRHGVRGGLTPRQRTELGQQSDAA